jgi:hypothetical protein
MSSAVERGLPRQRLSNFYQFGFRVYRPRDVYCIVTDESTFYTVLIVVSGYTARMFAYPTQQYSTLWAVLCRLH